MSANTIVKYIQTSHTWLHLTVALAYFHGLPRKVGKTLPIQNIVDAGDGNITVFFYDQKYWIADR
jgi:hypothetical protein